jgi:hypothetical protein
VRRGGPLRSHAACPDAWIGLSDLVERAAGQRWSPLWALESKDWKICSCKSVVIINDSQARASTVECRVSHEAHATHRHDLFDHDKRRYWGIVSAKCCAGQAILTRIHIVAIPIPDIAQSDHRLPQSVNKAEGNLDAGLKYIVVYGRFDVTASQFPRDDVLVCHLLCRPRTRSRSSVK